MTNLVKWLLPTALAAGLVLGLSVLSSKAADAAKPAGSKITGKVVDKEGKALEGATVTLNRPRAPRGVAAGASINTPAPDLMAEGGGGGRGGQRTPPVATATTDKEGKFEMKDVAAGDYTIRVMVREKGFAQKNVKVEAGKDLDAGELKLGDMPARGGGGGGR